MKLTRKISGQIPQIRAYTLQAGLKRVAADIFRCCPMGGVREFQAGDMAVGIFGAQKQSQRAAAGTQVQNPGIPGQPDEMSQYHGIGT